MRGKADCKSALTAETRITPAYAGKRAARLPAKLPEEDHPRLCGEKVWLTVRLLS